MPFEYANVGAILSMLKIPYLPTLQELLSLQQSGNVRDGKWTTKAIKDQQQIIKNDKLSTSTMVSRFLH